MNSLIIIMIFCIHEDYDNNNDIQYIEVQNNVWNKLMIWAKGVVNSLTLDHTWKSKFNQSVQF